MAIPSLEIIAHMVFIQLLLMCLYVAFGASAHCGLGIALFGVCESHWRFHCLCFVHAIAFKSTTMWYLVLKSNVKWGLRYLFMGIAYNFNDTSLYLNCL